MGFLSRITDIECHKCGVKKVDISLKNPYLDDFIICCANDNCENYEDGKSILSHRANGVARDEQKRDEYFREHLGEDDAD